VDQGKRVADHHGSGAGLCPGPAPGRLRHRRGACRARRTRGGR
jgi:hypothetical protein